MEFFAVGQEFDSFNSLIIRKKEYETATKNVLVIGACHKLKGNGSFQETFVYNQLEFHCKAGAERKTQSKGLRKSSTYKKNCPVIVSISCLFMKSKLELMCLCLNFCNRRSNLC